MMETFTELVIAAPAQRVYALASRTERWPALLPHYRFVRLLSEAGTSRIVEMAAWRDRIPIRWTALQTNDATRPHIAFRHLSGWTRGMDVEWTFEPLRDQTRVRIVHRLSFSFPLGAEWISDHVIGRFFIEHVAGRTLACIKRTAESR